MLQTYSSLKVESVLEKLRDKMHFHEHKTEFFRDKSEVAENRHEASAEAYREAMRIVLNEN